MRIIAGSLRGREIRLPKNSRIRPATGFVREKLMSLYTPQRLEAGGFLDICAGSGLVGFEALSRGARHAYFVEVDAQTVQALKDNAQLFGVAQLVTVLRCDARRCAARVAKAAAEHGAISCALLDAPYIPGMAQDLLEKLAAGLFAADGDRHAGLSPDRDRRGGLSHQVFSPDALLIARTPDKLQPALPGLVFIEARDAGGRDKLYIWRVIPAVSS